MFSIAAPKKLKTLEASKHMTEGIRTIIYPVKDIAQAKNLYSQLLGVAPDMDEAYYVGFNVAGQHLGLDPNGHNKGMTGPVGYWQVNDIKKSLHLLLDAGSQALQEVEDVGQGKADCICQRRGRERHRAYLTTLIEREPNVLALRYRTHSIYA